MFLVGTLHISELRNRLLVRVQWSQRWFEGHSEGLLKRSHTTQHSASRWGGRVERAGTLCRTGYTTRFLRCSPDEPDVHRCIGGRALSLRGWRPEAALAPSGEVSVVRARPRDDGYVFPGPPRMVTGSCGILHHIPLLRGWTSGFLQLGCAGSQRPPPVPFFPEVHKELTRSWKAPFTARNKSCSSSPLTTVDGGPALRYAGIPSVERSVAMQLCPTAATTLRGDPCLPSRACKYSLPKSTPPAHSWNQVRAVTLESPLHVVTCLAVTSLKPGSCISFCTGGIRWLLHFTPRPCPLPVTGQAITGPWAGALCSTHAAPLRVRRWPRWFRLHGGSRSLASAPSPSGGSCGPSDSATSIQFPGVPPKFRGIRFTSVKAVDAPVLRAENCSSAGEGCDRAVTPADMRSGF